MYVKSYSMLNLRHLLGNSVLLKHLHLWCHRLWSNDFYGRIKCTYHYYYSRYCYRRCSLHNVAVVDKAGVRHDGLRREAGQSALLCTND